MKKIFIFEYSSIFILGVLTTLSLPPLNLFLINFFTLSIFLIFLFKKLGQQKKIRHFFYYGWLFGFGYFLSNLYWITISLTFDKNLTFLIPFVLILIPAFLALFYSLVSVLFYFFNPKNIISAFFTFSLLFGITEFLRGIILTGFPWNLFIYSFSNKLNFISIISIIGTYSLNLIIISFFTIPALCILRKSKKEIIISILLLFLPILFSIYGTFQKKKFLDSKIQNNPYTLRIIGSNISLDKYYDNIQPEKTIKELISLSSPENKKLFFIWPEGILPNIYQDELNLYQDIFKNNFNQNHLIGMGIISRKFEDTNYKYYNSFSVFDNNLNLIGSYNKINLVPFGEFLPLENILNKIGLKIITNNIEPFTKGKKRKILKIEKNDTQLKFLPLICYEIIYSGKLINDFDFDFILNVSEDGWFGSSIGPKQHFVHSIFRAIENGKYVLRSSNNGMAAIINPLGQVEKKIDFGNSGYIDYDKKRDFDKTIFSTFGNTIFIIIILLYIFVIFSFNKIRNE